MQNSKFLIMFVVLLSYIFNKQFSISMFLRLVSFLAEVKDLCQLLPLKMSQAPFDRSFDVKTLQIYLIKKGKACWTLADRMASIAWKDTKNFGSKRLRFHKEPDKWIKN